MTYSRFCALLVFAMGIAGCVSQTPPEPAGKFFADPRDVALAEALQHKDWAGAEGALHAGANVNVIANEGMYPLGWAGYIKNKEAFEWLLDHGANPNISSRNEHHAEDISVLMVAAGADDPDWLRMLLAHKADPNRTYVNSIGSTETPLLTAVGASRPTNMKMLIAAGADINYQKPAKDGGGTAAIDAESVGFFEGVYMLIEAGADIRVRTVGGFDLTYFVARHPVGLRDPNASWREKVLQQLRQRGADVDGALKAAKEEEEKYRRDHP